MLITGQCIGLSGCASNWSMTIKPENLPARKYNEAGNLEGKVVGETRSKINSSE